MGKDKRERNTVGLRGIHPDQVAENPINAAFEIREHVANNKTTMRSMLRMNIAAAYAVILALLDDEAEWEKFHERASDALEVKKRPGDQHELAQICLLTSRVCFDGVYSGNRYTRYARVLEHMASIERLKPKDAYNWLAGRNLKEAIEEAEAALPRGGVKRPNDRSGDQALAAKGTLKAFYGKASPHKPAERVNRKASSARKVPKPKFVPLVPLPKPKQCMDYFYGEMHDEVQRDLYSSARGDKRKFVIQHEGADETGFLRFVILPVKNT